MIETIGEPDLLLLEKANSIRHLIGNTPLQLFPHWKKRDCIVFAKVEWKQLSGSVKARAAYNIILQAILDRSLTGDKVLLDATSGNTGIAYATICKQLGIKVRLCLPENASQERKDILQWLGVEIEYTSPFEGTDGSQIIARQLAESVPDLYYYADQYKNPNNWKAHFHSTGREIIHAIPEITHFVAGLGTTGTFIGTGRRLKSHNTNIRLVSLQPDSALHGLEGWKHLETAVVPEIYDAGIADELEFITTEEAYDTIKQVYKSTGILLSPSSAANLAGAFRIAEREKNSVVVTVFPDNADKYSDVINRLL